MTEKAKGKKEQKSKHERKNLVGTRGRVFRGIVTKKFDTRVVVEFERTVRVPKFERFARKKTKLHARINEKLDVKVGDMVKVQECRPLSKIIHFVVIDVLKGKEEGG
jgi:small subunit ribosomal protein S17